ncbi:hypothetical protein JCM11641_003945 [Rhodosporidiobolus odoratus]
MSAAVSPRRDACTQLLITCGSILILFTLFSLFRTSDGDSYSKKVYSSASSLLTRESTDLSRFSWHQCISGAEWGNSGTALPGDPVRNRQCHFKNVCVRLLPLSEFKHDTDTNTTIELTYYKSPMLKDGPEIWDEPRREAKPWLMTDRDHYLSRREVWEPLPKGARFVKEPTVLMGSFWPLNFGHALGDDMFPAFRLLKQFELVRPDNYYAFHQSCTQRGGPVGCENSLALATVLTSRPYQQLGGELFPDSSTQTCFADLVMGPNALTMRNVDERSWPDMVQHMKQHVGIEPNGPLKKHRVVVIEKHGRRTWLNYKEVREHIADVYGVETLLVDPAKMSVPEQLELLERTTVMLTPPGGISFSSTFLHKMAVAIYVEWWSNAKGRSFPMDQEVYTWNADLHPLFFPLQLRDLSLDKAALDASLLQQFDEDQLWQGYANVTMPLDRLDVYLRSAFAHVSEGLGMKLPPGLRAGRA